MKLIQLNELEKIVSQDINNLQKTVHESLYDKLFRKFFQDNDGCVTDSFLVEYVSATQVSVRPGIAFRYDGTQVSPEPKYRSINLPASLNLTIGTAPWAAAPSNPNNRYDIIVIRPKSEVTGTSNRFVKLGPDPDDEIEEQTVDKIVEQTYEIDVVEGTAGLSPTVPATPSGWMKIAEVFVTGGTGIASANDVVDSRTVLLPAFEDIKSENRYVDPGGNGTDTTLAAAISNLPVGGGSIILLEDISLNATVTLPANTVLRGRSKAIEVTFGALGKIEVGASSRATNFTCKTVQTGLTSLIHMTGARAAVDNVKFDVPALGTNVCLRASGAAPEILACEFLNCDENGTNTSVLILSDIDAASSFSGIQTRVLKQTVISSPAVAIDFSMLGKSLQLDTTSNAIALTLPVAKKGFWVRLKDIKGLLSTNKVTLTRLGSEKIEGLAANYDLEADFGSWLLYSDGTDWFLQG